MSDGEFQAYLGLLGAGGLLLAALALRGFDQRPLTRALDGLVALGFLGYGGYLYLTAAGDPATVRRYSFAFAAPLPLLLLRLVLDRRRARRRRLAAGFNQQHPYAARPPATQLTPFPPPPPPLGATPAEDQRPDPHHRATYEPLPSGLPRKQPGPSIPGLSGHSPPPPDPPAGPARHQREATETGAGSATGAVSGPGAPLPGWETFRHSVEPPPAGHDTASGQETTSRLRRPAYLDDPGAGGRHRASEPAEPDDWPPGPR